MTSNGMQKARIFLFLGIWITVLPYLGFPYFWKDILTTFSGLGLVYVSLILYKESKTEEIKKGANFNNSSFRENEFKKEEEIEI